MQDRIHFTGHKNVIRYIAFIKRKIFVDCEVFDIIRAACDEIIHANDFMTIFQQMVAKMRAEKPGCACDQYSHYCSSFMILLFIAPEKTSGRCERSEDRTTVRT